MWHQKLLQSYEIALMEYVRKCNVSMYYEWFLRHPCGHIIIIFVWYLPCLLREKSQGNIIFITCIVVLASCITIYYCEQRGLTLLLPTTSLLLLYKLGSIRLIKINFGFCVSFFFPPLMCGSDWFFWNMLSCTTHKEL